jgi:tRNA A-37 threonylcarbamoyl transferase component Bud32
VHAYAVTVVDDAQRGDAAVSNESVNPPSVVVQPADGDVVGGVYRLTRLLGAGMFGKVFFAQREDVPEHRVALKLLPRSHYVGRNVERELVMLATVGHPHVVRLKDHGMTAEYVWFTMPVYQGETLAERLARGPLEMREAHDVFLAVASGLEALHAAGLRHQDIKPENIYLAVFGKRVPPILLDLGVAAEREATFVAGTALYASPEQLATLRGKGGAELPLTEKMDTCCERRAAQDMRGRRRGRHAPGRGDAREARGRVGEAARRPDCRARRAEEAHREERERARDVQRRAHPPGGRAQRNSRLSRPDRHREPGREPAHRPRHDSRFAAPCACRGRRR